MEDLVCRDGKPDFNVDDEYAAMLIKLAKAQIFQKLDINGMYSLAGSGECLILKAVVFKGKRTAGYDYKRSRLPSGDVPKVIR